MATLTQGLADPVFGSQAVFRAVMRAMAEPGRIETLPSVAAPPPSLGLAAAAVCLALADFETPVWLSPALAEQAEVGNYLRFHTGATLAGDAAQAAFAIVDIRCDALDLSAFAQGTPEYPDRGATVVLICDRLFPQSLTPDGLTISGPGLRGEGKIAFQPMPANLVSQWRANRAAFPLGVDLIATAGDSLVCLPRSARIVREAA